MLNYDQIKNMPSSRSGKLLYGILAALVARTALNQAIAMLPVNSDGALFGFLMAGVLVFTIGLAIVRYDNGRPLFEPLKRG